MKAVKTVFCGEKLSKHFGTLISWQSQRSDLRAIRTLYRVIETYARIAEPTLQFCITKKLISRISQIRYALDMVPRTHDMETSIHFLWPCRSLTIWRGAILDHDCRKKFTVVLHSLTSTYQVSPKSDGKSVDGRTALIFWTFAVSSN